MVTGVFLDRVTARFGILPRPDRSRPVRTELSPVRHAEPGRNSAHRNPSDPGPTLYESKFSADPESAVGIGISDRKLEADSDRNF